MAIRLFMDILIRSMITLQRYNFLLIFLLFILVVLYFLNM